MIGFLADADKGAVFIAPFLLKTSRFGHSLPHIGQRWLFRADAVQ